MGSWVCGGERLSALEVTAGPGAHLDPAELSSARVREIARLLSDRGLRLSSLACYNNLLEPDKARRAQLGKELRSAIKAAADLGVDVVCILAGFPMPGKDRMQTIEQDLPASSRLSSSSPPSTRSSSPARTTSPPTS